MKRGFVILVFVLSVLSGFSGTIDLSGKWMLLLDREDVGVAQQWFNRGSEETVVLPGSLTTNGKGDDISLQTPWMGQIVDSSWFKQERYAKYRVDGNLKIPAWLQPRKYYKGVAWYTKEVIVPEQMAGVPILFTMERPHWETTVWVDGEYQGMCNSLGVPHRYTLKPLSAGVHRIAVRVDNRIKDVDVGHNAHSVSDHTQSNWNGMVGELSLKKISPIGIKNVALYPDFDRKEVRAVVTVENLSDAVESVDVFLSAQSKYTPSLQRKAPLKGRVTAEKGLTETEFTYPMGSDFYKWDEFTPYLYTMTVALDGAEKQSYDFGMRKFETVGKRFQINNRPIFLRGTLECAIFPKTGYPAMNVEEWARIFNICKAHGLNHVRFHSWCPPRAAFEAADRLGVYLQVEGGGWVSVGDGGAFDTWIFQESDRILAEYGNHPSFVLYTYGNEPSGNNQGKFLGGLVDYLKAKDSRHLYTSAAGWPAVPENEYRNDMYPRLKVWGASSPLNSVKPRYDYNFDELVSKCDIPWVSHEIGQWCVYPDFKEINRYDDAVLQAKNFEIFRETLAKNGMSHLGEPFLMASGKLQTALYKAEIESAMRTKDFAGFQLLDLHDFPGQGTALVGVLNPFWESKGYVSAAEYHRFASATVPVIRTDKVVYAAGETMNVPVEISHFGAEPLKGIAPSWRLQRASGELYASGSFPRQDIGFGSCIPIGVVETALKGIKRAEKLTLTVDVPTGSNSWDFWVYPRAKIAEYNNIKVVKKLDTAVENYLAEGGTVLLVPDSGAVKPAFGGDVQTGFSTIFWNSAWTRRQQPPLTLGLLVDSKHPALADFPTEYYTTAQWYDAITGANVVNLTAVGAGVEPIVRVIDDWFENRSLGLLFEVKVGKGKLVFLGADIAKHPGLENTQLVNSILGYMSSDKFEPKTEMRFQALREIFN